VAGLRPSSPNASGLIGVSRSSTRSGRSHFRKSAVQVTPMPAISQSVHVLRPTFHDWAAECTSFAREVCEMALAHVIRNATEATCRRGELFDNRRRLTEECARFCVLSKLGGT